MIIPPRKYIDTFIVPYFIENINDFMKMKKKRATPAGKHSPTAKLPQSQNTEKRRG
jgi:hypothetical protein